MVLISRSNKRCRNKGGALTCKDQNYRRGAYSSSSAKSITYGKVDHDKEITNPNSPVSYLLEVF